MEALRVVFAGLRRVLRPQGVVWLDLGEPATDGLFAGVPWRVALAMRGDGWILRNAIIWSPQHPAVTPDQPGSAGYRTLFLFARQRRYFFDLDAIRRPATCAGRRADRPRPGSPTHPRTSARAVNPGDVWITPAGHAGAKADPAGAGSAGMPIEIAARCIAAGCPPGGVVLDPFTGRTGTTAQAAHRLERRFLGLDTVHPSPAPQEVLTGGTRTAHHLACGADLRGGDLRGGDLK